VERTRVQRKCVTERRVKTRKEVARGLRRKKKKKRGLPGQELGIAMYSAVAHSDVDQLNCLSAV